MNGIKQPNADDQPRLTSHEPNATEGPKCQTVYDRTLPFPEYVDVNQVDLGVKKADRYC